MKSLIVFALLFAAGSKPVYGQYSLPRDLYGHWSLSKIHYLKASAMSDAEIKRLSKLDMCFSQANAIMFGEVLINPVYEIAKVQADTFLIKNFGIQSKDVGFRDKYACIVKMNGVSDNQLSIIDVRLIIDVSKNLYYIRDGVVFILKKIKSKSVNCRYSKKGG